MEGETLETFPSLVPRNMQYAVLWLPCRTILGIWANRWKFGSSGSHPGSNVCVLHFDVFDINQTLNGHLSSCHQLISYIKVIIVSWSEAGRKF
jgi:hypothetical protein